MLTFRDFAIVTAIVVVCLYVSKRLCGCKAARAAIPRGEAPVTRRPGSFC